MNVLTVKRILNVKNVYNYSVTIKNKRKKEITGLKRGMRRLWLAVGCVPQRT